MPPGLSHAPILVVGAGTAAASVAVAASSGRRGRILRERSDAAGAVAGTRARRKWVRRMPGLPVRLSNSTRSLRGPAIHEPVEHAGAFLRLIERCSGWRGAGQRREASIPDATTPSAARPSATNTATVTTTVLIALSDAAPSDA